jgi:predicted TIM-barrel fold metal-dependent hydrolase
MIRLPYRPIDIHVHPSTSEYLERALGPFFEATKRFFRTDIPVRTLEEMAQEFAEAGVFGVLLAWDAETTTGLPPVTNDFIAEVIRRYPETFAGFASVDPHKGKKAVDELARAVEELGLIGLKLHPVAQDFRPDDPKFFPLFEKAADLGIPALLHTGNTGLGAGMPGGMGMKLERARPIYIDTLAAEFPDLTIIGAHPSWPWQDEMIMIALHKKNVYIDLSGWSPKYFPESLVREIGGRLQDKVLFGTDYPFITHEKWLAAFEAFGFDESVVRKVLRDNALSILGKAVGSP